MASVIAEVLIFENFHFAVDDAGFDEIEFFGGTNGDVDDASFDVGAAIGDFKNEGFAVALVGDAHLGAHGEGFVSGGHGVILKWDTTGGLGAAIAFDLIP